MDPQQQNPTVPSLDQATTPTQSVRQQIVERVNTAKNVLVTVGSNPSVDKLASALGLTFLLDKLGKHATAVFSGKMPPAIGFLDPEAVFEDSVDSLRDFVVALDKEKADKLRYKVEDDVVKIFITPYKTTLSEKDLQFSQGDFNVDVVIALGASKREELDKSIIAHGRILHDATVITINAGSQKSDLGSLDWNDASASSISEMLVSITESFGSGLLDQQISTALLTGIVAETNRFSNEKTSPKVMTMAAQLMAAGANQQLVATNLRQEGMISEQVRGKTENKPHDDNGEMRVEHGSEEAAEEQPSADTKKKNKKKSPELAKPQEPKSTSSEQQEPTSDSSQSEAPTPDAEEAPVNSNDIPETSEPAQALRESLEESQRESVNTPPPIVIPEPVPLPSLPELKHESEDKATGSMQHTLQPLGGADTTNPTPIINPDPQHPTMDKPTFGGTLNATTAGAEEDREEQMSREASENNIALEHQINNETQAQGEALDEARQAIEDATAAQPFDPSNQPIEAINAQPLPTEGDNATSERVDSNVSSIQSPPPELPSLPEPSPVDAFMQPHQQDTTPANPTPTTFNNQPSAPVSTGGMPPLPPLPTIDTQAVGGGLPPLPPLPGQPSDHSAGFQPQINPGFMSDLPQSQNAWTEAGQEMAAKQAEKAENRQAKMDKMTEQYDAAVERNQEIQQQQLQQVQAQNDPNDHSTFPLPPTH